MRDAVSAPAPIERVRVSLLLDAKQGVAVRTGAPVAPQEASAIALDHDGNPYIPATTLKGALRSAYSGEDGDILFGAISNLRNENTPGVIGAVMFDHAYSHNASTKVVERRRTAIDRTRGAAEQNLLFAGRIAIDVTFTLELGIAVGMVAEGPERFTKAACRLANMLAPLADGLLVGTGTRNGLGRLTYAGITKTEVLMLRHGELAWAEDRALHALLDQQLRQAGSGLAPEIRLTLQAECDYISIDSAAERGDDDHVQIRMAHDADGQAPLLSGSSVMGALRSRAAWLAEIDWLRGNHAGFVPPERDRDTMEADDRFRNFDPKVQRLDQLSSVERLFGVPGWAGLIRIASLDLVYAGETKIRANVAIDRLSGGALDGALFHTELSRGPRWLLSLALAPAMRRPGWNAAMQQVDKHLLTRLIDDLTENGLALGHGASKGLGWMKVQAHPAEKEQE